VLLQRIVVPKHHLMVQIMALEYSMLRRDIDIWFGNSDPVLSSPYCKTAFHDLSSTSSGSRSEKCSLPVVV
jgi:hypothetical protein